MHRNLNFSVLISILVAGCLCTFANGQDASPAPLTEQLKAQYTTVQGCSGNGTVLIVQKDGIVGVPQAAPAKLTLTAKYRDGQLHAPSTNSLADNLSKTFSNPFSKAYDTYKNNRQPFTVGSKVLPAKIDANLSQDTVTLGILACTINYKANVDFQFAKGALQKLSAPEIVDTISQVLAFDQPQEPTASAQNAAQPPESAPSQNPPPDPPKVHLGQTMDEVVAALGQPEKKIDLGAKQIFIYKNYKITFKDGRVADAE